MSRTGAEAEHAFELHPAPGDEAGFATLVYREGERRLEVELESTPRAAAWLALDEAFCQWSEPAGLALEPEHVDRVLARLATWEHAHGLRITVGPALDPLTELHARGFALQHHRDGSVTALPPAAPARGFLARLFGR